MAKVKRKELVQRIELLECEVARLRHIIDARSDMSTAIRWTNPGMSVPYVYLGQPAQTGTNWVTASA